MRIERIELDGFGRFHDARFPLDDGLTVLVGANEAGKTTLLNGLRALLFGFEATRDGRTWYPALAGGRRGGRLVLRAASGERWTVERHGDRGGGGALAVRAPNGNQGGQETLDRLLHGADRDLFNNIFAFGLSELQSLSSLSAEGVRARIYGARAGLGGTSALDLERRLRQQLDAGFLPRGSQRPLNQLLARIEELRHTVADLARQPEEHAAAHAERAELLSRATSLRVEARAAREELTRLRHLRDALPAAAALVELEGELTAGDATLDDLPTDAVTVLDRRLAELAQASAVLGTVDEQLDEARRERAAIAVDERALRIRDGLAALLDERPRRIAAADRRRDLASAVQRQEGVLAEQLARVGGWEEARLLGLDDSIPAVEATRAHDIAIDRARSRLQDAEQRRRAAADEVARLDAAAVPVGARDEAGLADRAEALRELDGIRAAMAMAGSGAPDAGRLATVAVVAATLLAAATIGWAAGLPLLGAIAGLVLAALAWIAVRRLVPPDRRDALSRRRAELLSRLELPADADEGAIGRLADEVAEARARARLAAEAGARHAAARAEREARDRDAAAAAEDARGIEDAWEGWLAERALPAGATPEAVRHLLGALGVARRAAADRDHQRAELSALVEEEAAYRARVDDLLRDAGVPPARDDAERDARLLGLAERRDRAVADQRRATELDGRIAQLTRRREAAARVVEERRVAVDRHLAALGCPDPDAVRRREGLAAVRRRTQAAAREHRAHLAGIAGGSHAIDALLAQAGTRTPASLEAAAVEAQTTLERLEADERDALNRIGALDARIRELEATEELGARRQELAVLEGRARAMARDWAVKALALRLLEETRSRYERERQPDVVRAAERHFERITAGRYSRIVAPPGDASVRVETDGGEGRVTEELSRGTGEQLYLALRFGLIEEFARHAEPLPVVMDDILVNFDAERADRAAAAIRDLAQRHQVLYFTCHRWTAELLDPGGKRTHALG